MSVPSLATTRSDAGVISVEPTSGILSSARAEDRVTVHQLYSSDPKYKKFAQQVDKCLNAFDNVHEWADCIAFLKQLLKTFQSYMQFKDIPRKLVVAKRLSQCLNPALPTGVHQRALDVYAHILAILGTEGLKRDLALWSSGLFPFFEYAATSVKPLLLEFFETYYLPLQGNLRPVMKSFILALLPGLEEDTSEFFEKVLSLLDRLSGTVSPVFFLQNIWLVMLTMPSARGTSLNFLSRRLPRLHANEDITQIVGHDIGLMIRAFAAALEDDNLLVRRSALDLLLQTMRMDSAAIKRAQHADRIILMRAATGVVLRRDLSLNRRLYTWLLGPEEKADLQVPYFREHALDLLTSSLKDEMFTPSGEYSESRPFKIFISLLDKWEIGSLLTDALVYDAFQAIRKLIDSSTDSEDIIMTASTLYEAVEPNSLWGQLLVSVMEAISNDGAQLEAIQMTLFALQRFAVQDEEIQRVHFPVFLGALVTGLTRFVQEDPSRITLTSTLQCLSLAREFLRYISPVYLHQRSEPSTKDIASLDSLAYAYAFYSVQPQQHILSGEARSVAPVTSIFEDMTVLSIHCAKRLVKDQSHLIATRDALSQVLLVFLDFVEKQAKEPPALFEATWEPSKWLQTILEIFDLEIVNFTLVDRIVSLIIALHQLKVLQPALSINRRVTVTRMVKKLFQYLRLDMVTCHVRAVNLIWSLESAVPKSYVESIIAHSMSSPESRNVQESYEAFGVLWRLTEDSIFPGFKLKVPMMTVLDLLQHDDPGHRRIGETWMRCSLKSYTRVLDPILYDLLDPVIRRTAMTINIQGKELQSFVYDSSFDQRYVHHILEILLSVVRFGGQGFTKNAQSITLRRSNHPGLLQRVETAGISVDATYLDAIIEILLRFLQSEPKEQHTIFMNPLNVVIQSTSVDLLQMVVARGEIDSLIVDILEAAIIGKLYLSVHLKRLDLQNKLLHILHSLISASATSHESSALGYSSQPSGLTYEDQTRRFHSLEKGVYNINPLLVQTLVDGIASLTNRPVLQHWLDFILMALPHFQPALHSMVTPITDCLCRQLRLALSSILRALEDRTGSAYCTSDAEFVMLLNALERLILLSFSQPMDPSQQDDEMLVQEKAGHDNNGLLGYVSNVFGAETTATLSDEQSANRSPGYKSLHDGVRVLYAIFAKLILPKTQASSSEDESFALIFYRARLRCRRVLEHIFRVHPMEVLESIIDCWDRESPATSEASAFELVDVLVANAQNAVNMVCESISYRMITTTERSRKQSIIPNLSDIVLLNFLEQYLRRLEGPLALQVWPRFLQLTKDVAGNIREFKVQNFLVMKCLCVLADKFTQTPALDEKRVKKDLQESYGKLLDSSILFVGRSYEQTTWVKRTTKDAITVNGRESPAPRTVSDIKIDEKFNASSSSLPDSSRGIWKGETSSEVSVFIANTAVPNLRKFLVDNDKVVTVCSNIIYYIVNPALKTKPRPLETSDVIVDIIRELTKIQAALKVWRPTIFDLLIDNRLFNSDALAAIRWKPIFKNLADADKTTFPELLGKIATAPSANIFSNKENESLLRSLNLRRLSLVLFTGEKNQFLVQLPTVQEKLVDILRNVSSPIVQSEVYLCIRVLLCRLPPHNLTSFWPVILTELYRLFSNVVATAPSDGSDDLQLILAACKCLDLLLVLQTEEFQIHQWMFITDTVDAVYRPDDYVPVSLLDQLAEIIGSLPLPEAKDGLAKGDEDVHAEHRLPLLPVDLRSVRRPLLSSIRVIDSLRDLIPFLSHVSIASYESVYASNGNVDWEAVERAILDDMFDGR